MQRTWIIPLVVSLALGCGNRSNNNNGNRRPALPNATPAAANPSMIAAAQAAVQAAAQAAQDAGTLPDGAAAPMPVPSSEPAVLGDGGAASAVPSSNLPSRDDGQGGRVYEADGITATVRRDGYVHIVTTDRWSGAYDQTYESCSFVKNALPTLQRTLTEENAAFLQGVCGEASDLSPEVLRLIQSRRGARPGPARPAPARPAAARPAAAPAP